MTTTTAGLAPDRIDWLLGSDPAVRWQVERDLLGRPDEVWRATRGRVATEGRAAAVLARQDPDGQWAGGAYFPGREELGIRGPDVQGDAEAADAGDGQPWVATTWSLNALRECGLDAAVLGDTAERLAANSRWEYDDLPYWDGEVDCCINAFTLANGTWLGADVSGLVRWFPEHQMADGGWNCMWAEDGSVRGSFHSTLNSLEGIRYREEHAGTADDAGRRLREARLAGQEYLLERGLLRRLSTGEPVGDWATRFGYPFRWYYSVLRAADHFRRASALDGTAPDPRMAEAIAVIRDRRRPDGTWLTEVRHPGLEWFPEDVPVGEPSPWLTLYGARVLAWWDGQDGPQPAA